MKQVMEYSNEFYKLNLYWFGWTTMFEFWGANAKLRGFWTDKTEAKSKINF